MSTLLVDNYDSYTYNVFHLLAAACGEEPIVVHNDMVSWKALERWDFDAIVLSPGPGHPARWHDFGVCADILRSSEVPVLGVCLGHQGLGHVLKATVTYAPTVMHGRLSPVKHSGEGLFAGIPQDFEVVRYHSLAVSGSLGEEGREIAWTADGVVMGIEHASRPMWGVQFHPESICTEYGHQLFENFYALAQERKPERARRLNRPSVPPRRCRRRSAAESDMRVLSRTLAGEPDAERLFERLFGDEDFAFWLDSASTSTKLGESSFLGSSMGACRLVLEYDVEQGVLTRRDAGGVVEEKGSFFEVLDRELEDRGIEQPKDPDHGLVGGFVGYLGYELKGDCGATNAHRSDVPDAVQMLANRMIAIDHVRGRTHVLAVAKGEEPEAEAWLEEAEREVRDALAVGSAGLEANGTPSPTEREVRDALAAGQAKREPDGTPNPAAPETSEARVAGQAALTPTSTPIPPPKDAVVFRPGRGREQYLADIARCQSALGAGESYEVCLTDQIHTDAEPDPWTLYRGLRRSNPAPFAAYLKLGELAVVSSSPERFLSVDRERRVMARPIKGTAPRSADPEQDEATRKELAEDEKTFAEHLMIVDLLRNDLGRVCEVDTVRVPELMVIEQYTTVHQMISNVVGTLEAGRTSIDAVRACFPGGSMTGAPKLRTMEIIDDIEREARGVYSGAIGYFGLDGVVDLSIVIRTVVLRSGATTIGAGGAIVMQSDPQEEFEEILLKARAPMAAIAKALTGSDAPEAWTVELEPQDAFAGTAS
ncbi:MAG TPA: aminodeoxychorismate synthase component I [Solirubrobacteraceae bacterium]|jgi:para-aminobenzoate synthetase|nr:aminodeoxychorismate synthase component I [Solirubrobacteraceae bacterium]